MSDLVLTTFDWVPQAPRGYVRDLRIRWALEEAGLPYRVESVPFKEKKPEHFEHQPFGQVPWLTDGDLSIFESGAILLHLGNKSDKLLPKDPHQRSEAVSWVFGALNSVEMATLPLVLIKFSGDETETGGTKKLKEFLDLRLKHTESVLADREWLAGSFSIADILLSDVLRVVESFAGLKNQPASKKYVERALARPAFKKAHADQMAHFAKAD